MITYLGGLNFTDSQFCSFKQLGGPQLGEHNLTDSNVQVSIEFGTQSYTGV